MTLSPSRPTLHFKLTSTRLLEAIDLNAKANVNPSLSLRPGVPGEMLVQLENTWETPLHWQLEIKGDFHPQWCNWERESFETIEPKQTLNFSLTFLVPENFFEDPSAFRNESRQLKLDYQVQVAVQTREKGLVAYQVFNLFIRPPSSYVNCLPGFYGEIDFVRRLVSLFEQAFDPAVQTMDVILGLS